MNRLRRSIENLSGEFFVRLVLKDILRRESWRKARRDSDTTSEATQAAGRPPEVLNQGAKFESSNSLDELKENF